VIWGLYAISVFFKNASTLRVPYHWRERSIWETGIRDAQGRKSLGIMNIRISACFFPGDKLEGLQIIANISYR